MDFSSGDLEALWVAVLTLISPFSKLTPASSELARCAEVTAGEAAESGGVTAENRTGVGFN